MPKKINLGVLYWELNECVAKLTPNEFQQKIASYSLNHAALAHWIKAYDFQFIYLAIEAQNTNLVIYFFNQIQILSKNILFLRDHEFLRMSIAQTNPQIFNFLYKHLSKQEQQQFLLKHGTSLYGKAIAQNLPHLISRLFELNPNAIETYINHETDKNLLQIAYKNAVEIWHLMLQNMPEESRINHLKSQSCHFLKSCILLNKHDLIHLMFRYQPDFFLRLNPSSRLEILAFIAYFAGKKSFDAMVYFIHPGLIGEIAPHITEGFLNELDVNKQKHIFEFLIHTSPNLKTFLRIYFALKNNDAPIAQTLIHTYKPLLHVYEFLDEFVLNRTYIPEEIELLNDVYPFVSDDKKLELIELFFLEKNVDMVNRFRFKSTFMNIANRKIKQFELDEHHHIHPFFPTLFNYYLPIIKKLQGERTEHPGFLLNFSLQLIEQLGTVKAEELKRFPPSKKGFYNHFISQLIHTKNHIIYKSLKIENKALAFLVLLEECQHQQINCMTILSHAAKDISFHYQTINGHNNTLRISPHEWAGIFKELSLNKHFLTTTEHLSIDSQSSFSLS